ncbi:MAG TPA: hypothetical protein VGG64_25775 [Pirellulales bacterium]|jgi:hypothetical protein
MIEFENVTVIHDASRRMLVDNLGETEVILERQDGVAWPVNLLPDRRIRVNNYEGHPLQVRVLDGGPGKVRVQPLGAT